MALTILGQREFDPSNAMSPELIHISGTVYALVYLYTSYLMRVKTLNINADGTLGSNIASFDCWTTGPSYGPEITHISGDVYVIAFQGPDSDGWLITLEIDSSGNITDPIIDSHEFDTNYGAVPTVKHISGTTYAIVYAGSTQDGWLKTITIGNDGSISADPELDYLEFDTVHGIPRDLYHISGDIYAIPYTGYNATTKYDTRIATVSIDSAGNIGDTVIDSLQVIPPGSPGTTPVSVSRMAHVANDVYVIALTADSAILQVTVYIYTFTVSDAGAVGDALTDSSTLDIGSSTPDLVKTTSGLYAIAYKGLGSDGWLKTIAIAADGTIGSVVGTIEFDTSYCAYPSLIEIAGDVLAVVYAGSGSDGWLKTIGEPPAAPTVTTQAVTDIQPTTATGNGNITDLGSVGAAVKYENYITGEDSAYPAYASRWSAQTFRTVEAHIIKSVKVKLSRWFSLGEVVVAIRATDNDLPTEDDLCSGSTDGSDLPVTPDAEWREITLDPADVTLDAYTLYAIVVRLTDGTSMNCVYWRRDATSPTYPIGRHCHSTNYGVSWSGYSGVDNMFEEWGCSFVQHGVCWNTTGTPTTGDNKTEEGAAGATGAFTSAMTGLVSGTHYYVRAYATNAIGTGYGSEVEFTAGESTFPVDAMSRVSSIRHIFRPGFFRMQVGLGDLGFDVDVAEATVRKALDTAKDDEADSLKKFIADLNKKVEEGGYGVTRGVYREMTEEEQEAARERARVEPGPSAFVPTIIQEISEPVGTTPQRRERTALIARLGMESADIRMGRIKYPSNEEAMARLKEISEVLRTLV